MKEKWNARPEYPTSDIYHSFNRKGCGDKEDLAWWRRCIPNTMFTTARGQNRTFYFPPANCLISCCRWRAGRTAGEENGPVLAQGRTRPPSVCLILCDGSRLAPLWSFAEIPSGGIWRCLSTLPFFYLLHFFPPPPSQAVPDTLPAPVIVCFAALALARLRMNLDVCEIIGAGKIAKAAKRSVINLSF